LGVFFLLEFRK